MSHVDVKNLKPSSFEEEYYDKYEYYNLTDKYAGEPSHTHTHTHIHNQQLNPTSSVLRGLVPERPNQEGGQ